MASLSQDARSTPALVTDVFDTGLSDEALNQHINAAAMLVNDVAAAGDVSDNRLELIETYLAAHFASSQDPRVSQESVGDASMTYRGPTEKTQYWDTAVSLDPTGALDSQHTLDVGIEVLDGRNHK